MALGDYFIYVDRHIPIPLHYKNIREEELGKVLSSMLLLPCHAFYLHTHKRPTNGIWFSALYLLLLLYNFLLCGNGLLAYYVELIVSIVYRLHVVFIVNFYGIFLTLSLCVPCGNSHGSRIQNDK